ADWLFPVSKIWPTLFVIHFGLAGVGTYLLTREMGARRWVAFVGGLMFQFTGLMMSWVLAGQEGRIIVAALTPLIFFFLHRGIRTGALAPFAGAAAAIGFALLTFQIQSSYYMLLAAFIWSVFLLWHLGLFRDRRALTRVVLLGVGAVAFGFALASVNFLPFSSYVAESPRGMAGGRGYEYSTSYSMPPGEISALAVPEYEGYLDTYHGSNPFKLHVEYVGATVILLVALGFYYSRRNRYWWLFLGLTLFALSLSFGGNTPLYRLYYELLPGTKKFRAPAISFFLVSLSLAAMATLTLEAIAARLDERRAATARTVRGVAEGPGLPSSGTAGMILGAVVLVGLLLGAMSGSGAPADAPPVGAAAYRFAFFAVAVAAVLWFWIRGALGSWPVLALLGLMTVGDLWIVDRKFFQTVPPPDEMFARDDVVDFLQSQPQPNRTWILPLPAGSVYRGQPGNYLMGFHLDQAGGEHGNQLQRYNELVGTSTETLVDWHNFFSNPRVVDTPQGQAVAFDGVPAILDAANIRYVVSMVPIDHPGFREVHRGTALVYENTAALPRAYLAGRVVTTDRPDGALQVMSQPNFDPRTTAVVSGPPVQLPATPLAGDARVTEYTPDRVAVTTRASRQALLVLADNYYEAWTAEVDGRPAPVLRTDHTFRGVVVPAGEHRVVFAFHPAAVYTGMWIYLAGMGLLLAYGIYLLATYLRRRRSPAPE
ncbi:MAG: YfhO family protein, partial [Gemmatimonadetes bacterium]|nr:YfhO family protein [Gemmatimonadota bacterium]